jgi:hypothetical protein
VTALVVELHECPDNALYTATAWITRHMLKTSSFKQSDREPGQRGFRSLVEVVQCRRSWKLRWGQVSLADLPSTSGRYGPASPRLNIERDKNARTAFLPWRQGIQTRSLRFLRRMVCDARSTAEQVDRWTNRDSAENGVELRVTTVIPPWWRE